MGRSDGACKMDSRAVPVSDFSTERPELRLMLSCGCVIAYPSADSTQKYRFAFSVSYLISRFIRWACAHHTTYYMPHATRSCVYSSTAHRQEERVGSKCHVMLFSPDNDKRGMNPQSDAALATGDGVLCSVFCSRKLSPEMSRSEKNNLIELENNFVNLLQKI